MRVLYSFPLEIGGKGIGMTAYYQIRELAKLGVDIRLYCGTCIKPIPQLFEMKQWFSLTNLKIAVRLLGLPRLAHLHDRLVARALMRDHNDIDIVHCWPSASMQTLKTARKLGIKTVLERPSAHTRHVYNITTAECQRMNLTLNKSHYAAFNEKKLRHEEAEFAMADKLLCPSDFVAETFRAKGFGEECIARHRYGYDPAIFSPVNRSPQKDYDQGFNMLYVGDCYPLKGLHFALEAWLNSEASKIGKFVICGKFMLQYQELLKDQLSHPSVEYLGFVEDIQEIMRQSDVLVLPSLAEGSALVTYEARACGCVLLVSKASGAVCEHMKNALVHEPGDSETLSRHITLLVSNRALLGHLRKNSIGELKNLT